MPRPSFAGARRSKAFLTLVGSWGPVEPECRDYWERGESRWEEATREKNKYTR